MNELLWNLTLYGTLGALGSAPYWWPYFQRWRRTCRQRESVRKRRAATVKQNASRKPLRKVANRPIHVSKSGSPYGVKNRHKPTTQSKPKPPAPKSVPASLLWKLDRLTSSRETSDRLVNGLSVQHPGRSRKWLVEKAIADLERDRFR